MGGRGKQNVAKCYLSYKHIAHPHTHTHTHTHTRTHAYTHTHTYLTHPSLLTPSLPLHSLLTHSPYSHPLPSHPPSLLTLTLHTPTPGTIYMMLKLSPIKSTALRWVHSMHQQGTSTSRSYWTRYCSRVEDQSGRKWLICVQIHQVYNSS